MLRRDKALLFLVVAVLLVCFSFEIGEKTESLMAFFSNWLGYARRCTFFVSRYVKPRERETKMCERLEEKKTNGKKKGGQTQRDICARESSMQNFVAIFISNAG